MVEDARDGDQNLDNRNAIMLAALLRSSFEDVNNLRRVTVAKGYTSCLDKKSGEVALLSSEESRKLNMAKSRSSNQKKEWFYQSFKLSTNI